MFNFQLARVPLANKQTNVRIMGAEPADTLPIERMFVAVPQNKELCAFCQYFLHYLQVELSDTNTEVSGVILNERSHGTGFESQSERRRTTSVN